MNLGFVRESDPKRVFEGDRPPKAANDHAGDANPGNDHAHDSEIDANEYEYVIRLQGYSHVYENDDRQCDYEDECVELPNVYEHGGAL